jgi:ABC-type sugar transport system permease subunit
MTETRLSPSNPKGKGFRAHRYLERERALAWIFILPALLIVFALILAPIVRAFWMSLHIVDLKRPALGQPFVGLQNYIEILQNKYFWASIGRTLYFMFVSIAVEMVAGISVAMLLNQDFKGRGLLRTLILIPWALPITIDAIMWKWIFNPEYGAFNSLLFQLGLIAKYQTWLSDPMSALHVVIVADVWKVTPLVILLTLAALQTIPHELYEAAMIDGASRWRSFWNVTLPLLTPTLLIVLVVRTMDAFKVFDIIYIMTSGGPSDGTKVIAYYTYIEAFSFLHMGTGAALAYLMTFFIAILAFIYIRLMKNKEVEY